MTIVAICASNSGLPWCSSTSAALTTKARWISFMAAEDVARDGDGCNKPGSKVCRDCQIEKSATEFYVHGGWLAPRCKECAKAASRANYKKNTPLCSKCTCVQFSRLRGNGTIPEPDGSSASSRSNAARYQTTSCIT